MTAHIPTFHLQLLGAFQLILNHQVVPVTTGLQRLIAFLALHDRLLPRMYAAGVLWPDVPTGRANANLRAGLWRLPTPCRLVIEQSAQYLRLADTTVDLGDATALASGCWTAASLAPTASSAAQLAWNCQPSSFRPGMTRTGCWSNVSGSTNFACMRWRHRATGSLPPGAAAKPSTQAWPLSLPSRFARVPIVP